MAGNKNSGNITRYEKIKRGDLLDICTDWLINNFHKLDQDSKVRVALDIAKRGIAEKREYSGEIKFTSEDLHQARDRAIVNTN